MVLEFLFELPEHLRERFIGPLDVSRYSYNDSSYPEIIQFEYDTHYLYLFLPLVGMDYAVMVDSKDWRELSGSEPFLNDNGIRYELRINLRKTYEFIHELERGEHEEWPQLIPSS